MFHAAVAPLLHEHGIHSDDGGGLPAAPLPADLLPALASALDGAGWTAGEARRRRGRVCDGLHRLCHALHLRAAPSSLAAARDCDRATARHCLPLALDSLCVLLRAPSWSAAATGPGDDDGGDGGGGSVGSVGCVPPPDAAAPSPRALQDALLVCSHCYDRGAPEVESEAGAAEAGAALGDDTTVVLVRSLHACMLQENAAVRLAALRAALRLLARKGGATALAGEAQRSAMQPLHAVARACARDDEDERVRCAALLLVCVSEHVPARAPSAKSSSKKRKRQVCKGRRGGGRVVVAKTGRVSIATTRTPATAFNVCM